MNKLGTTFFFDNSDCRGLSSFCNSPFNMIVNSKLMGELLEVSPVLFVRRMYSDFLTHFPERKATITVHTSNPPVPAEMFGNKVQYFGCCCGRFRDIIHTIQKLCERAIIGGDNSCFSTSGRGSCIFSPFACLTKQWQNVWSIVSYKSSLNSTGRMSERNMPICPNKSEKIGIDFIHLFWENKGRWINIPFVKWFVQFALHNVGAMFVCKAKTHCLGICYNGMARAIKFSRTISSTKSLVVLPNEIKFGVS